MQVEGTVITAGISHTECDVITADMSHTECDVIIAAAITHHLL